MTIIFHFLRKLIERAGKWANGKEIRARFKNLFKRQCNKLNQCVCFQECFLLLIDHFGNITVSKSLISLVYTSNFHVTNKFDRVDGTANICQQLKVFENRQ